MVMCATVSIMVFTVWGRWRVMVMCAAFIVMVCCMVGERERNGFVCCS
jgi:hypothetical protein